MVGKKCEKSDLYDKDLRLLCKKLNVTFRVLNDVQDALNARGEFKVKSKVCFEYPTGSAWALT